MSISRNNKQDLMILIRYEMNIVDGTYKKRFLEMISEIKTFFNVEIIDNIANFTIEIPTAHIAILKTTAYCIEEMSNCIFYKTHGEIKKKTENMRSTITIYCAPIHVNFFRSYFFSLLIKYGFHIYVPVGVFNRYDSIINHERHYRSSNRDGIFREEKIYPAKNPSNKFFGWTSKYKEIKGIKSKY